MFRAGMMTFRGQDIGCGVVGMRYMRDVDRSGRRRRDDEHGRVNVFNRNHPSSSTP